MNLNNLFFLFRDEYNKEKRKEKLAEEDKKESLKNAFSNDGSFLDQFKKLSKTGLAPNNVDVQTLAMVNKRDERDDKQNYDRGDYYR